MAQTKLMNEQEAGVENVIALDKVLKLRRKSYKKQKRGKITTEADEIVAPDIWARAAVMSPSSLNVNLRDGLTDKDVGLSEDEAMGLSPTNQQETRSTPSGPLSDFMKVNLSNYDVPLTDFTEQNEFSVVKLKQDSEVTDFSLLYSRHLNGTGPKTQECNFVKKENESNHSNVLQSTADDQDISLTSEEEIPPTTSKSQKTECTDDSAENSRMEEESPSSFSASGAGTGSEIDNPRKRKSKYMYRKTKNAKTLREHGKPYPGKSVNKATGKMELKNKKGRKLGKRCSCTVDYKSNKCCSLDEGERQNLFDHIWSMSEAERRIWISSVVNVSDVKKKTVQNNSRRSNTMVYYLFKNEEKVKVCKTFFLQTTGLCQWWVREWAVKGKETKHGEERQPPQTPAPAEEKCPDEKSEKDEPHGVPSSTVKVIGGRKTVTESDELSTSCQLSVEHPDATTAGAECSLHCECHCTHTTTSSYSAGQAEAPGTLRKE